MKTLEEIKNFWNDNPCGETLVGKEDDLKLFFRKYDDFRYKTEGHILKELDRLNLKGKNLLEIGLGQAADSEQIIRRGARWSGLDVTSESVFRAQRRFELFQLPVKELKQGSADQIPYPDHSFDLVYSHGVLHHIPQIGKVSSEIRRVLKPGGKLVVMLYHKNSLNYYLSINVIRRFLMVLLYGFSKCGGKRAVQNKILKGHIDNAKKFGLIGYLRNPLFMIRNTDGPENPYSKIYDLKMVAEDFKEFRIMTNRIHFLNERQLPFFKVFPKKFRSGLATKYGWHLWVEME